MTKLYNINELSIILGFTVAAIHGHLARKNFEAVPPPIKLGRRLAWPKEVLDEWLQEKVEEAAADATQFSSEKRRRGRPRKMDRREL